MPLPSHPALFDTGFHRTPANDDERISAQAARDVGLGKDHFVAQGWENLDIGPCPCGELVRWDDATETWQPDRSLVLLVLTPEQVETVLRRFPPTLIGGTTTGSQMHEVLTRQITLNESIE